MAIRAIEDRGQASLYDRIRQDIEQNVMSGAWPPGHRIPYEHELMKQYDCSRMTINRALGTLVERGLIERRKRAGSFVSVPRLHRAAFDLPDLRAQVIGQGQTYGFALLERTIRKASASDREHLAITQGDVLHLTCVHTADGTPCAYEDRIIALEQVPEARTAPFDREPPGSWLLAHVPWSDARHRIGAIDADAELARLLAIPKGAACLALERWTWRIAEKITYVRMIHPGHLFSIEAHFRP
jgi:GntR family histidine utilization transcriptional repressor